jgi:N-acylneuraminate cytidylyltransferase
MKLAVIPARAGSKRIPQKNIKNFLGRPIISWAIEAAINSNCFDVVIVSTDDENIAEIARSYGALTPFLRPAEISNDFATTSEVVRHAIEWMNLTGNRVDKVCCLYATAPFVRPSDIEQGLQLLLEKQCEYVYVATTYGYPIQRALRMSPLGSLIPFDLVGFNNRSQDFPKAYHDAGQFYWAHASTWISKVDIFTERSFAIITTRENAQDIDELEDWRIAEMLFKIREVK